MLRQQYHGVADTKDNIWVIRKYVAQFYGQKFNDLDLMCQFIKTCNLPTLARTTKSSK